MKPKIVERPAFHVVGVRERFETGKIERIPEVWGRFVCRADEIENAIPDVFYGVCVEDAGSVPPAFHYTACAGVTSIGRVPDGMSAFTVPAATYAVFTHRGPVRQLFATVRRVWAEWLPASGLKPTRAPDFELYDERFAMDSPESEVDVYVPVERPIPNPEGGPMTTKDDLLSLMLRECDICIHLHGKLPAGSMDFRFTPPQRSTRELLQYLSFIGLGATRSMVANSWDPYQALANAAKTLDPADFPAAMERQKAGLRALFAEVSEKDLAEKQFTMPWKDVMPLGKAMLALAYASLVAYRMQLFLHAKASGNAAIGTANCWGGIDMPA